MLPEGAIGWCHCFRKCSMPIYPSDNSEYCDFCSESQRLGVSCDCDEPCCTGQGYQAPNPWAHHCCADAEPVTCQECDAQAADGEATQGEGGSAAAAPEQQPAHRRVERGRVVDINYYNLRGVIWWTFVLSCIVSVAGVTCNTCYDQIPGCTGGVACPYHVLTNENTLVAAGSAAATAASIVVEGLLSLRFLKVLTRPVLDCILLVRRRPPPGAAQDLSTLTVEQLADMASMGGHSALEVGREIMKRMATAGTQIEISRLNAINSVVSSMQKADTDSRGPANVLTLAVGGLRYAYAMAQRVTVQEPMAVAGAVDATADGSTLKSVLHHAKLVQPKDAVQMCEMLHAAGL